MRISEKGIDIIKKHEGYRSNAYLCPAGVWTIGWGNTFYSDGTKVKEGDFIYTRDANQLLMNIINQFEIKAKELVEVDLQQHQWDAIISFIYNIGIGNFRRSTLLKKLNENPNDPTIIHEFLRWNKAGGKILKGLKKRRNQEAYLFNGETSWK